jgi:hypothetical protein
MRIYFFTFLLVWVLGLTFSAQSVSAAAGGSGTILKAESDPKEEWSIKVIEGPTVPLNGEASLRVRFEMQNISSRTVRQPEIEIRVIGPDGAFRGFYGTRLLPFLAAGEKRRFFLRTDSLTVRNGDTIVLVPVHSTLKLEGAPTSGGLAENHSWTLPEKLTPEQCDRTCEIKNTVCDGRCTCGITSFTCSCPSGGGISYTCQCMTCSS